MSQSKVGDTLTSAVRPAAEPLPGYRDPKPMVYAGLFPIDNAQFPELRDALDKLKLNDAALIYTPETSVVLASASAAASWVCCTWKSSTSDSPASSAST